jgi:hypothetical protein
MTMNIDPPRGDHVEVGFAFPIIKISPFGRGNAQGIIRGTVLGIRMPEEGGIPAD